MGKIQDWYDNWLLEQAKEAVANGNFKPKPPRYILPAEIVKALRGQAEEAENNERDPRTKISTCPKETTLEWQAANLLDERSKEIERYETMREKFVDIWLDLTEILGENIDQTLA